MATSTSSTSTTTTTTTTPSGPAIGIDLGTTHCCVGVYYNEKVHIIPNQEYSGDYTIPSYVYLDPDGHDVVGMPAKLNAFTNPENTIYDVKRILGREMKNPELQNDIKFWPFTVQESKGIPMVMANEKLYYPEEISAKLLTKLKTFAEKFLGLPTGSISKAVITVPAYFHDGQRQATVDAGELAGLKVLTILNEPTAAAIAYNWEKLNAPPKKVLIYDLGGGTFDVAVLNMEPKKIEVLGVNGDTHLGGEDFDRKLMEHCVSQFKVKKGIDLLKDRDSTVKQDRAKSRRNLRRLQTACEITKKYLAAGVKGKVSVDAIINGEDLVVDITRQQFEDMNKNYFDKTITLVDSTLNDLGLTKDDIQDIVLVGGSTRILKVQELLTNYFEGRALNHSIHPDQAVAYGAAIHAAIMTGEKSLAKFKLDKIEDVTPMPLGVEVITKKLSVVVPKNTKVPVKKTVQDYGTTRNRQTSANFPVYQGTDLDIAANNRLLGKFTLYGIPPKAAGEEKLDVTMEIDTMGILHVSAACRSNQRNSSITVKENKNRMSEATKRRLLGIEEENWTSRFIQKLRLFTA